MVEEVGAGRHIALSNKFFSSLTRAPYLSSIFEQKLREMNLGFVSGQLAFKSFQMTLYSQK